jgi:mRNA interferase MazF
LPNAFALYGTYVIKRAGLKGTGFIMMVERDLLTLLLPPSVQPRIRTAPKVRQIYWCDFPRDAQLPEMWKTRPVVVVSYKNSLHGPCLVAPISTKPQYDMEWAWELSISLDGRKTWVVCNHLYTIAPSRLSTFPGKIPRLSPEEFSQILQKIKKWLP